MTLIKPNTTANKSPYWKMDFWVKGKRICRSTGETSKAKALMAEARARLAAEDAKDAVTMKQLGEWDVRRATYKKNNAEYITQIALYWERFAEFFGTSANVTIAKLEEYGEWGMTEITRYGDPVGNVTINRELAALSRGPALAEAYGPDIILKWPSKKSWPVLNKEPKRESVSVRGVDADQLRVYMAALEPMARLHTYFRIVTGLRRTEMERIELGDIEVIEGVSMLKVREKVVRPTPRRIPLTPLLVGLIRAYHLDFLVDHRRTHRSTASKVGMAYHPHPRTLRGVFTSAAGMSLDPNGVHFLCGRGGGINDIYERATVLRLERIMGHVHAAWPATLLGPPTDFPAIDPLLMKKPA